MKQVENLAALCLAVWSILCLSACGDEDLMLEDELDPPFYLGFTDTVRLDMSTVLADSIVTSGKGRILSGYYEDEKLGNIMAQSYFQLGLNANLSLSESAVFDSLVLYLAANEYVYGDTTQIQHLSIHRLLDKLIPEEDDYFYNTQRLSYADSIAGEIRFLSSAKGRDSLAFRLSDAWGQELFELVLNHDPIVQNEDDFQDYLPGFTLVADTTQTTAVLGYTASADKVYMRLYYHETTEELQRYTYDFPLSNASLQFNRIQADRSSTLLASLTHASDPLPDSTTQMETFAQGGTGLMTKFTIPSLDYFPELSEYLYITKAELVIEPLINGTQEFPLPDSLFLLSINHYDEIVPILSFGEASSSVPLWTSILQLDDEYDRQTEYRFNITDFITEEIQKDAISDGFLLLAIPSYDKSVSRLYLGGSQHEEYLTRLEISYVQLNNTINQE